MTSRRSAPEGPKTIGRSGGLALAVMLFATACGGSGASPTAPTSYSGVEVRLNPPVMPPGETSLASVWASSKGIDGPIPVTGWTSSNRSVATVSASGVVTAIAPGTTLITGAFDGGSHAATLGVFGERDLEGLNVTCGSIPTGFQFTQCNVTARTRVGEGPVKATWTSSRPEVAPLATDGSTPSAATLVLRKAKGQTVVTATYGAFSATATVDVQ